MSKLLSPNEILSAYQAVATLVKIIPDHDLMVDFRGSKVVASQILADIIIEAKTVIAESVKGINETVKHLIPSAVISVCYENDVSFRVEIGRDYESDVFHIRKQGENLEIVEGFSLYSREANLIKRFLELLNKA